MSKRYVPTLEERIASLGHRWPIGTLIRHYGSGLRGVVVPVRDVIAARWNDGRPGHAALLPFRDRDGLGGLLHIRWEHGDACWVRVDMLTMIDRTGLYRVHGRMGAAPMHRLANDPARPGEQVLVPLGHPLPDGWRWTARDEQLVGRGGAAA
ncbi:hypothetical protein [Planobispora takensis]|uniref:Uncharacterized protein n=1 Tax=Planobispora takensis TaxID=1367882 RepID=A0A8J3SPA2_9ACTN|nr:hypothetical protein [Planobispora takensis]GIH98108.1 hypothetical protein Pta02_01170 [Planobispora takensis]